MLRLLRAETYRLVRKKSLYLAFGGLVVAYVALAVVRSGGFTDASAATDAQTFFWLLPGVAGGLLFAAIYADDLTSKSLITLVGHGTSKAVIVATKLVLMVVSSLIVFGLAPLVHLGVYAALGWPASAATWHVVVAIAVRYWLLALGFAVLSGIVAYALQKVTFAVVAYLLLAFSVVTGLLTMALKTFAPGLVDYLLSGVTVRVFAGLTTGAPLVAPAVTYVVYLIAAAVVSVVAFTRREMEF